MIKSFQIKLNARKQHVAAFEQHLKICALFYNHFLSERISAYKQSKTSLSCFAQQKTIKDIRQNFDMNNQIHTHLLQNIAKRVDLAYKNFFRRVKEKSGKAGFPRFKSIDRFKSFSYKEHGNGYKVIVDDNNFISKIKLSNIGSIKVFNKIKLPMKSKFLTGTLIKKADGYYFVVTCSFEEQSAQPIVRKNKPVYPYSNISHKSSVNKNVGIDVGIKQFLSTSDGDQFNCKQLNSEFLKIKKLNKILKNKKKQALKRNVDPKSSRRFRNAQEKLAKHYLKIARIREDFQHKVASFLIKNYQHIVIEELNIKKIIKNKFSKDFCRRIHSAAWGKFFTILEYKAENAGILVQKVPAFWTSQICAICLEINPKDLSQRIHHCEKCGVKMDRDIMAAKTILLSGLNPDALSVPRARLDHLAKAK